MVKSDFEKKSIFSFFWPLKKSVDSNYAISILRFILYIRNSNVDVINFLLKNADVSNLLDKIIF